MRFLCIIAATFLVCSAQAQATAQRKAVLGAVSLDADALAWRASVNANGGSVSGSTLQAVSNFCRSTKATGVWNQLIRINLFAGDQLAAALVPLKIGGGNSTETNNNFVSGDYVENGTSGGLKGNGTSKYIDTGYNPYVTHNAASESSFHLSAYVHGTESGGTSRIIMGHFAGTNTFLGWANGGSLEVGTIGGSGATEYSPSTSTSAKEGSLLVTTNGSRSQIYYYGGVATGAAVTSSGTFSDGNLFASCYNNAGTAALFSTRYLCAYSIGTGLSATDAANYYTALQTFQTALGRNL